MLNFLFFFPKIKNLNAHKKFFFFIILKAKTQTLSNSKRKQLIHVF